MKNLADILRDESISECVAFTEFMLEYKKDDSGLYCFFEGFEDRVYYLVRIQSLSKINKYYDYVCGGKDAVIKVHNLIKSSISYSGIRTAFFVDRDFDQNKFPDSVYVTPMYSIENFYCTNGSVEMILISEFKFKRGSCDLQMAMDIYIRLRGDFLSQILTFNAWLICQANLRQLKGGQKLNIDSKIKGFFDQVVDPNLKAIKDFSPIQRKESIEILYKNADSISSEELFRQLSLFKAGNIFEKSRGKFLIKFLESFLNRLQIISGTSNNPFSKSYSCSLRIENATICSNLSQYAQTPPCLKEYLIRVSS